MSVRKFFRKLVRNLLCLVAGLSAFAACAYTDYHLWPLDLQAPRYPAFPAPAMQGNRLVLPFTPGVASAEVASFNDQLEAFLRFEYLRGREAREGHDTSRIFLTALDSPKGPSYKIFIVTDNDLLTAVPQLGQLESRNLIAHYEFATWTQKDFSYYQQQSHMFDVAYDVPTEEKLETISSFKLLPALAQFLIFKSQTDNRVFGGSDPSPRPLTREQATLLATDVEDVGVEQRGLLAREGARGRIAAADAAVVGLRLEDQELCQRRKEFAGADSFELLLGGHLVGYVEHVALLLVVGKVFRRPGGELVVSDKVAAFELPELGDGS